VELETERLVLRPWRRGDEAALVRHANNPKVWINMMDRFPYPYGWRDAEEWIEAVETQGAQPENFAILLDGEPIGGAGFHVYEDVHRCTAELGYWIGEEHWGQGYATEALLGLTAHVLETTSVTRLQAKVFGWNTASVRVLEKAGYEFEARLRGNVLKDGRTTDALIYARFR